MNRLALWLGCCLLSACGPGKQCEDAGASGTLCIPDGGARADAPLTFSIQESCGSPCDEFSPVCLVTRSANELNVALVGTRCSTPMRACIAICSIRTFQCELGPLPAGTYSVRSGSETPRTLLVTDAGVTSCG